MQKCKCFSLGEGEERLHDRRDQRQRSRARSTSSLTRFKTFWALNVLWSHIHCKIKQLEIETQRSAQTGWSDWWSVKVLIDDDHLWLPGRPEQQQHEQLRHQQLWEHQHKQPWCPPGGRKSPGCHQQRHHHHAHLDTTRSWRQPWLQHKRDLPRPRRRWKRWDWFQIINKQQQIQMIEKLLFTNSTQNK